jgi:hypothetical protein
MIKEKTKRYLAIALGGAPSVFQALVKDATTEDYDRVVDPERFTLREMLAHISDWETIHLGRLIQFRDETNPIIQGIDEGEWAITHNHAGADPSESLAGFALGRAKIVELIDALTEEEWNKTGFHTEAGNISMAEYLILTSVHDGYHLKQTVEWLAA